MTDMGPGSTRLSSPRERAYTQAQDVLVRARRTNPVICLAALAAYLLNMAVAAGGAVLCHDPAGESSIEFTCDHDHCAATVESEHDHASGGCWCSSCPCEDTPLPVHVVPLLRDDDVRASTPDSLTLVFVPRSETQRQSAHRGLLAVRPPPALDRSLRQLRTVVLIV